MGSVSTPRATTVVYTSGISTLDASGRNAGSGFNSCWAVGDGRDGVRVVTIKRGTRHARGSAACPAPCNVLMRLVNMAYCGLLGSGYLPLTIASLLPSSKGWTYAAVYERQNAA